MKKLIIILGVTLVFLSSCSVYTCPTYTTNDIDLDVEHRLENRL